ncbi:phosphonate ABC transporter ATP-binding protein [Roseicella aerolata]|uniref:Phosphonate ABC transporter ATP-binding protein n=1 Tax=Roseicella aerolata TaxID=2883479 RepID=A0A9X1L8C6_9PROT|nr:phosphonate ABC transporter ATP-binding protein [Roseicella aerolata]MCB4822414.1 phosphonate ABC transporter ATP-binding protein [Roseicella aerolata]
MLELQGLTRCFGAVTAVDAVTLTVPAGQMVGVIGRSGAGKSTLLRMINRLTDPSSGRILHRGRDITALRGPALRRWRTGCAMIFQQFNLAPRLDVLTNVLVGRVNHVPAWRALTRLWPEADRAIALSALAQFDMAQLAAQRAGSLSGGQQQRVAIARALVQEPQVILADEPVASLDPRNAALVMGALAAINRDFGITVLVNIHSLDLARAYCERLVGLDAGRLVFDGPAAALTEAAARRLYGLEAAEAVGAEAPSRIPVPA